MAGQSAIAKYVLRTWQDTEAGLGSGVYGLGCGTVHTRQEAADQVGSRRSDDRY
jgi:hypothetical protein